MALDFDNPPTEPLEPLRSWLADAKDLGLDNPDAMTVATVDEHARPTARTPIIRRAARRQQNQTIFSSIRFSFAQRAEVHSFTTIGKIAERLARQRAAKDGNLKMWQSLGTWAEKKIRQKRGGVSQTYDGASRREFSANLRTMIAENARRVRHMHCAHRPLRIRRQVA